MDGWIDIWMNGFTYVYYTYADHTKKEKKNNKKPEVRKTL